MPDTNVWNYLAAHSDVATLARAAREGGVSIVVAPAVVYESMVVPDEASQRARAALLTDERWKRVMPEAFSEAQEVLAEVRRLRPGWLLDKPPRAEYQKLFRDWRRNGTGFWSRVRAMPALASSHVREKQGEMLKRAREETKDARKSQVDNDYPVWTAPLGKYYAEVSKEIRGGGDAVSVAAWRLDAFAFWSTHLSGIRGQPTPLQDVGGYVDWLSAELDFQKMKADPASWYAFWMFEVDEAAMPRRWMRWCAGLLQQFSSWSRGTPGDNQLAAYLIDADVFVTADGGFFRVVEKMRADAGFPIARPVLVSADEAGSEEVLELIRSGAR